MSTASTAAVGRFVDRMRGLRKVRGLSARELAERVSEIGGNLDRQAISTIENGRRGVQLGEALDVATALGVTLPDMVSEEPLLLSVDVGARLNGSAASRVAADQANR